MPSGKTLQLEEIAKESQRRTSFLWGKDEIILQYKVVLAAFEECLQRYEEEYGVSFDPADKRIPDVFKFFFQLQGMHIAIRDHGALEEIQAELRDAESIERICVLSVGAASTAQTPIL